MSIVSAAASRILPTTGPVNLIRVGWDRLAPMPGGNLAFSHLVGRMAPYTGSIDARVQELRMGYARVTLRDRPKVRNHLKSVHAIALANLIELTGNLALAYSLPDDARFIVAGMSVDYLKKARGTITGTTECAVPETSERREFDIVVSLWNEAGEEVARGTLRSLVGPKRSQ